MMSLLRNSYVIVPDEANKNRLVIVERVNVVFLVYCHDQGQIYFIQLDISSLNPLKLDEASILCSANLRSVLSDQQNEMQRVGVWLKI